MHGGGSFVVFKLCSELNVFFFARAVREPTKWRPWPRLCTVDSAGNQDCVGTNGQRISRCSIAADVCEYTYLLMQHLNCTFLESFDF